MNSIHRRYPMTFLVVLVIGLGTLWSQTREQVVADFLDMKLGMFVHFNMSTFARQPGDQYLSVFAEHEVGTEDEELFNPVALDMGQWADAAAMAGMKYVTLTTKHHGGFCLWNSETTTHDVGSCSWRGGQADVVGEFVDSVRSRGLIPGFYFSMRDYWGRDHNYGGLTPLEYTKRQLTELLTNYGPILYLWFDGWVWSPGEWGYDIIPPDTISALISSLQPNCLILDNPITDGTWDIDAYEQNAPGGGNTHAAEASVCLRNDGVWFYHPEANCELKDSAWIMNSLEQMNNAMCNMNLDITPNDTGLIPLCQVELLRKIGDAREIVVDISPPTAPASLLATATSDATIDLTWQPSEDQESGVRYYRVYREDVRIATIQSTSYSDGGLQEVTSYTYTVTAVNGGGVESEPSAPASAQTLSDATPPSILSAEAVVETLIMVTFDEPVSAASAQSVSNYVIGGLAVAGAVLLADSETVTLTTATMTDGLEYTLTVSNIADRSQAGNTISVPDSVTFTYTALATVNPYAHVEAESFLDMNGVNVNGSTIGGLDRGDWLRYGRLYFDTPPTGFTAYVASAQDNGVLEIRLDIPTGEIIGTCEVGNTGGWGTFVERTGTITGSVTGVKDIFITFNGRDYGIGDMDWFTFTNTPVSDTKRPTSRPKQEKSLRGLFFGPGNTSIRIARDAPFHLDFYALDGRKVSTLSGRGNQAFSLGEMGIKQGIYLVAGHVGALVYGEKIVVGN